MIRPLIFLISGVVISWLPASVCWAGEEVPKFRLSYEECVEMALKNNDQIRATDQDIQVSLGKVDEAHPRHIPVVKYEHRIAPVPEDIDNAAESFFDGDISIFNSFKIEIGSPVTTFGKLRTAQYLANLGVDAAWFKKKKTADEVAFRIYQVYEGILLARELIGLADQARDAINKKVQELETEQILDQMQILKMKVTLYEIERKVEEASQKKELAISTLKLLTGLEQSVDLGIAASGLRPVSFKLESVERYIEEAGDYRPEYKLLETGVKASEKKLKLEKLQPVPNLGVGGFFDIGRAPNIRGEEDESTFTNPFNYTKAGVGLQLKGEFDYVKTTSKVKQAKAELLKTIYEKRAAVRGLELEIRKTYSEVKKARSLMWKASKEKKAARQMVFLTKSNLDIGLGDKKDYLDALQSYLLFQGREYEAIYNNNVAICDLKMKTGRLYAEQRKEFQ